MRLLMCFAAAMMTLPTAASAKPVYLDCSLSNGTKDMPWSISLNEEEGTITFSHEYATKTERAIFTPDFVTWAGGDMKIDRSTLAFTRAWEGKVSAQGTCKIAAPKKRAF